MELWEALSSSGDAAPGDPPRIDAFDWGPEAAATVAAEMQADGAHDTGHIARVFEHARKITRHERRCGREVDWEIVAAAVLFHDVVNRPKDAADRSSASRLSAERAVAFFEAHDALDPERRERLAAAIERHSYSRGLSPQTIEAKIVCDADRLEAIGAVGIARCFYVSGTMEGAIAHPADPFAEQRSLDDTAFAIDHFFEKLLRLRDTFLTPSGRELAAERHAFVEEFLEQFSSEIGGPEEVPD